MSSNGQAATRPRHSGKCFFLPAEGAGDGAPERALLTGCRAAHSVAGPSGSQEAPCSLAALGETGPSATLLRYRIENERLRDQVKAHAVQEALLTQRLQELSARNTALHLKEFREKERDSAIRELRDQLVHKAREAEALRREIEVLSARIRAHEGAAPWPFRADGQQESVCVSPDAAPATQLPGADGRTHELLCQVLGRVGCLVRAVTTLEHCSAVSHGGVQCPRTADECATQHPEEAMQGNAMGAEEMQVRGAHASCEELAMSIREKVMFCETVAARVTAHLLAARSVCAKAPNGIEVTGEPMPAREPMQPSSVAAALAVKSAGASPASRKPNVKPRTDECEVQ
ncbi:hypothetical protein TRVL_07455 [Trypanosoma vivax]|nr:hypothetical protein TRVL_07455 [Trypanosoma vivax]